MYWRSTKAVKSQIDVPVYMMQKEIIFLHMLTMF